MEIPFYYSFKEFEENYKNDLENWLKNYPDAIENDFKNESIKKYNVFYSDDDFLNTVTITNAYDKHSDEKVILQHFGFVITNRLEILFENVEYKTESDYISLLNEIDRVCGYSYEKNKMHDAYFIGKVTYKIYIHFFKVVFDEFLGKYILELNKEKFKNFEFVSRKIRKFLNNEIKTPEIQPQIIETPENDFSEPETIEQTKIKVEMIVLKELGIIDLFKKSQNLTNSEIAKRLVYILNDKLKNANTKNPQSYIENILTAIANGTPEINSDKTPYKKQNIKNALISLNSIGLSIDDTIYLKNLKNTHSNLFE